MVKTADEMVRIASRGCAPRPRAAVSLRLAVAAMAAMAAATLASCADGKAAASGEETVVVEERTIDDTISVSGNLKPLAAQDIRAPVTGQVAAVYVKAGARVRKGERIAAMESASASYEVDRLSYDLEVERLKGNLRRVSLLEAELGMRRAAVDALTIRAHLDGVVSKLDIREGDVLTVGESYGRVVDASSLVADVEIAEMDISRARVGLYAEFSFPALPGVTAAGRLESFPAEARVSSKGLVVLDARLVVDDPPEGLLPFLSFEATIVAGEPRSVLVVDSRAVTYLSGKPAAERVRPDGAKERVELSTEGFGAGYVRVVSGLSAGDVLAVPGQDDGR
ncbi:MAG: efflux RND transporter periplasmic adaptor subunit [Spirochaetes bacterium]|nr:efflux RND transporter periplasmic adaptor subunit [Spirochaetota bacterium]MBU1081282.1 efflux RND transporter periplasmic adaptor subunit [Spirochaetota bacterium]